MLQQWVKWLGASAGNKRDLCAELGPRASLGQRLSVSEDRGSLLISPLEENPPLREAKRLDEDGAD